MEFYKKPGSPVSNEFIGTNTPNAPFGYQNPTNKAQEALKNPTSRLIPQSIRDIASRLNWRKTATEKPKASDIIDKQPAAVTQNLSPEYAREYRFNPFFDLIMNDELRELEDGYGYDAGETINKELSILSLERKASEFYSLYCSLLIDNARNSMNDPEDRDYKADIVMLKVIWENFNQIEKDYIYKYFMSCIAQTMIKYPEMESSKKIAESFTIFNQKLP